MAELKAMNEAQRAAYYASEIQRAKSGGLTDKQGSGKTQAADPGRIVTGSGVLQTSDTARHVHAEAQRHAAKIENWLTPTEIVQANSAGRQAAYARGEKDGNAISRAGEAAVRAAADAKAPK